MKFREIAALVINASPAGQTEVLAMEQDESLTRFANNFVHQNVTELNAQVTVRSVIGTRVGIAVSNDTRHDSLKQLAARAYEVAKLQPENPEFKGLPRPLPIRHVEAFDPESLAVEALSKVRLGADPMDYEPGEYAVILDPYATADLLEMLAFDGMGALAVQEGRSWMNGRIGQRIMADIVTIVDDGLSTAGMPWPFDFEGIPKKAVPIVASGIAQSPVYDSFTAGREE